MYTAIAFVLIVVFAILAGLSNRSDRKFYDVTQGDQRLLELALHIRQDLKLVCFLLGGIIVMAGIIADRLAG